MYEIGLLGEKAMVCVSVDLEKLTTSEPSRMEYLLAESSKSPWEVEPLGATLRNYNNIVGTVKKATTIRLAVC